VIQLKRVYEPADPKDGQRFLIERLWPRGMKRSALKMTAWVKDAGPSRELRVWFGHEPAKWDEFRRRYFAELDAKRQVWNPIAQAASEGNVTLLYSSHDTEHNNAVALKQYLDTKLGSGEAHKGQVHAA
jgi:uncharacterized protein YeaO (DUF488 family)